jgi:sporulation integral membrane protein YlbJ
MGFVAGYPMGAKIIRQLLDADTLSPSEAQKMLCFSNNCGPLFIVGTVGSLMLNNTSIGYFLLVIHLLSALLISLIFSSYGNCSVRKNHITRHEGSSPIKLSALLNDAVKNAMDTLVCIGGFIIFFSVIASIISTSPIIIYIINSDLVHSISPGISSSIITGLLELSNGINKLCNLNMVSIYRLALISFMISFGGLCIHFQTSYVLGNCHFSLGIYVIAKLMQAFLSFILVCFFYPLYSLYIQKLPQSLEVKWLFLLIIVFILFTYSVKLLSALSNRKSNNTLKTKYNYNY